MTWQRRLWQGLGLAAGSVGLGAALLLGATAQGQDAGTAGAPPVSDQEVVDRLRELQEEIERLLPYLPPELRRQVAAELAGRAAAQKELAEQSEAGRAEEPEARVEGREPAAEEPRTVPGEVTAAESPEPSPEPRVAPPEPSAPAHRPATRTVCNTLDLFDTRKDGRVDSGDRYWRYLYLWNDEDGDGQVTEREVRSVFEAGVRNISVRLERFEGKDGSVGLLRVGRWIVLDPRGDGFSGGLTGRTDDGALTVDASALGRFSGPQLLGADGRPLEGMQPFRPGLSLREASGRVIELSCPR